MEALIWSRPKKLWRHTGWEWARERQLAPASQPPTHRGSHRVSHCILQDKLYTNRNIKTGRRKHPESLRHSLSDLHKTSCYGTRPRLGQFSALSAALEALHDETFENEHHEVRS